MTLTEFLLARIAEDEAESRIADLPDEYFTAERVLAECEAKRRIIALHESWPVLVNQPPTFEAVDGSDPGHYAYRASQQIAWLTTQEYRNRFGDEPPTGPILAALALPYADHPDFREEWKS